MKLKFNKKGYLNPSIFIALIFPFILILLNKKWNIHPVVIALLGISFMIFLTIIIRLFPVRY